MDDTVTIYMPLLDEGVPVWRPVMAELLSNDNYKVLGSVPDDEEWAFSPGSVVRCRLQMLSGDWGHSSNALVAYEKVDD